MDNSFSKPVHINLISGQRNNPADIPIKSASVALEKSESEFLTRLQLAKMLGMSLNWVVKHTQAGRIPGQVKFGGSWRYRKSDIDARLKAGGQFLLEKAHAR